MSKSILFSVFLFGILNSSLFAQALEDVVYLKNGGLMRGIIIEQIPNQSLKIQTREMNVFVYKFEEIEKIAKEEVKSLRRSNYTSNDTYELYPGLSCVFSAIIPGTGQIYNRQYSKGAIILLTSAVFGALYVEEWKPLGFTEAGLVGYSMIWLYSVIDAPVNSIRINRKNNFAMQLSPAIIRLPLDKKSIIGLSYAFRF